MMVVEDESSAFNSPIALMASLDDEDKNEESFIDVQQNLKDYSKKDLRAHANILIDEYHNMIIENESLDSSAMLGLITSQE